MGVDEAAVRAAFKARKAHIAANLNMMTLKTCRETLEADLGVNKGTLKPFKKLLGALIDRILARQQAAVEPPDSEPVATEPTVSAKKQPKSRQKAGSDEEDEDDADEQVKHSSKRQKRGEKQPAKTSGPRQYSKAVEKLRGVAKAATVTIPPTLYVKNKSDEQLQAALEALLEKHDLDAHSGQSDIQRARARLQTQRDLDGIDTSNIIQGGRGRRSAAPTSFKPAAQPASGSDSEGEVEESDSEGSEGEQAPEAGSDSGPDSGDSQPAKPRKTALRDSKQQQHSQQKCRPKPAAAADSESAAASSEDESDEAASEDECAGVGAAAAAKAQSGRSPNDENEAAKSNDGGGVRAASKGQLAVGLEDSDDEGLAAPAAKRRGLTEWSEDDD